MPPPAKLSHLAWLSLVLGLLLCIPGAPIVGLICGFVARSRIARSNGQLKGNGLALAGIIVSAVMLLLSPAMLLPAFARAKQKAQVVRSMNNLRAIAAAAHRYADNHGDQFPPAANWTEALRPYLGPKAAELLRRPGTGDTAPCGYGYNFRIAGSTGDDVGPQTVLFFELNTPRDNAVGGEELLRRNAGARGGVLVALGDGSVQQVSASRLAEQWKP